MSSCRRVVVMITLSATNDDKFGTLSVQILLTSWKLELEARGEHGDVTKLKYFPCYWPFVRGIHRWPVNSSHKGQWRGALMFSLICACTNGWTNNQDASDLRRNRAHYDVTVMTLDILTCTGQYVRRLGQKDSIQQQLLNKCEKHWNISRQ